MYAKIMTKFNEGVRTMLSYIEIKMKQLNDHPALQLVVYAITLLLLLEMLSRRSILKGFGFIINNPLMFLMNFLIILLTLSITMMFSRKNFMLSLITMIWLGLGFTNFFLLGFRTTPLAAMDFYMLKSVFGIIKVYLNTIQIILIACLIILVLAALVLLWFRMKKGKAIYKLPVIMLCVVAIFMVLVSSISLKVNARSTNYGNLADAYSKYGFAYCFSVSVFDRGIKKPVNYSEENIDAVLKVIESDTNKLEDDWKEADPDHIDQPKNDTIDNIVQDDTTEEVKKPNIVMVQLESFFDVNHLLDYSFSENPVPNFTKLKEEYSYGYLTVPSIGAGTANTEFEIITGMNLSFFGAGEYPYKTILQSTTSESICYNLDELGYHSHAIHNNTGTFYDRNKVFPKLGFDSFNSIEYMNDVEYNPIGWAKDKVLIHEIRKALDATKQPDFIYTISVQPHGKYPNTQVDETQKIKVIADPAKRQLLEKSIVSNSLNENTDNPDESEMSGFGLTEHYKYGFEYFVNQVKETDQFIGELVNELSTYQEPTIVVFYGDHLPSFSLEDKDFINNNRFQTEYVLWSNFPLEQVNQDVSAYQLNAYIMERLGYNNGILTKFHKDYKKEADYLDKLELLQYDMLYGPRNVFKGENPYQEKIMKMGILEVVIHKVEEKGDVLFVEGDNFTPWSIVYVNDESKETFYVDKNTLIVPYHIKNKEEQIYVAQVTDNNVVLSHSEPWVGGN